ncbi:MAG: multidrug efflux pump [Oceanicoccus sp.]|jgi:multidrug efflux pump
MNYISAAIEKSRTTLSIMVMLMLSGYVVYLGIPLESNPDVSVPVVVVIVPHEGISPEDAERLIAKPMELELRSIEGVDKISSVSAEGAATIIIEFGSSFDSDQAIVDVREAVDKAKVKIPSTSEEPIVQEIQAASFPVLTISFGGKNVPERVLYSIAMRMRDKLETIPAVLQAELQGHREELLEVLVDPAQLEIYGITNDELFQAVNSNNRLIAAGALDTGKGSFSVKVPGLLKNGREVLDLPVKSTSDGVITLENVTNIRRTFKDAVNFTRANGSPAISLEISKRQGSNLIDVVNKVKAIMEAEKPKLPPSVEVNYLNDQAPDTLARIKSLEGNISTAVVLVLTVVVAAVGLRSGILVALGIPFSFLFSFIILNMLGFTYNFMVMFGLLLGLGMLIDGAIVVVEFADRKMTEGMEPKKAYVHATRRMFWPVLASVATTLAAFLPLMFWPGVTGDFMKYLPVTVFAVMGGSLLYALLFAPVLGALFSKRPIANAKTLHYYQTLEEGDTTTLGGITGAYARLLQKAVNHPFLTLLITIVMLFSIVRYYGANSNGTEFFTSVDPEFSQIMVSTQGNFSATEIRDIVVNVEDRLIQAGYSKSIYTRTGAAGFSTSSNSSASDNIGSFFIELTNRSTRDVSGFDIEEIHRDITKKIPGVRIDVLNPEPGPPVGKDVQIQLSGLDMDDLISTSRMIKRYMETEVVGLVGIDDSAPVPGIEWRVTVDRAQAAMLGADVTSVGTAVQLLTNGVLIGQYRPDDAEEEIDIRVRYPVDQRGIHQLDQLRINTRSGQVPVSSFIKREAKPEVSSIQRLDGTRVMFVRANTKEGVLAENVVAQISEWLETVQTPPDITIEFKGANEEQSNSLAFIGKAFSLALLLMAVLLVTQFNNFYQSALILSAVIMSTVGVLLGLIILGQSFSAIMTGVGIVALSGIIVNNNIVLIDTYNYLRVEHKHWDIKDVIIRTGAQRLRPVFLTTFTTGFGLLPMASGISVDLLSREIEIGGPVATFWVKLASSIVVGLSFATVLTLIVTPAMLIMPYHLKSFIDKIKARLRKKGKTPNSETVSP